MTATKDENKSTETTKSTSTPRQRKTAEEPPREELTGVLRTSRIGPIEWHGATSGSSPDQLADRRHERLEEAKKPGDDGYNAYKDPMVPSSTLADAIMTELAAEDSNGNSPTWDALNDAYQEQYEERAALKKFREDRAKRAS